MKKINVSGQRSLLSAVLSWIEIRMVYKVTDVRLFAIFDKSKHSLYCWGNDDDDDDDYNCWRLTWHLTNMQLRGHVTQSGRKCRMECVLWTKILAKWFCLKQFSYVTTNSVLVTSTGSSFQTHGVATVKAWPRIVDHFVHRTNSSTELNVAGRHAERHHLFHIVHRPNTEDWLAIQTPADKRGFSQWTYQKSGVKR